MGKIFIVMGKSATGKDTIYSELVQHLNLRKITCYTTRPIRSQETEGVEYHFVSEEQMKQLGEEKKIIECRSYHTINGIWYYFTADDGQFDNRNQDYAMVGTLAQYEKIRNFFGTDRVYPIYIEVSAYDRLTRSINRESQQENPNYAEVCRRFLADEIDFSEENIKIQGITKRYINDNLAYCIEAIEKDILLLK